jgi:hypothetical protein
MHWPHHPGATALNKKTEQLFARHIPSASVIAIASNCGLLDRVLQR